MNDYQLEQLEALTQAAERRGVIDTVCNGEFHHDIQSYFRFRQTLDRFLSRHFGRYCTRACFENRTSACCSKDGIITFWADIVLNIYSSDRHQIAALASSIEHPLFTHKCIYLGESGCRWQMRPLGCALFLCDGVQADVLDPSPDLRMQWEDLKTKGKGFRWPDRPVLFDRLEQVFISDGCRSPLMYINTSPGLLRVKRKAGLL